MKHRYCLTALVMLLLILISINSFSQRRNDTVVYISKYPVKKGYIYLYKDNIGSYRDPANTICIFSRDNKIFAVKEGKVKKTFTTGDYNSILIGSGDTIVLYGNIDKFYKNVGDTIHKGDLIGTIKKEAIDDRFELFFKIAIGRKDMFYDDHIKFLQSLP